MRDARKSLATFRSIPSLNTQSLATPALADSSETQDLGLDSWLCDARDVQFRIILSGPPFRPFDAYAVNRGDDPFTIGRGTASQ